MKHAGQRILAVRPSRQADKQATSCVRVGKRTGTGEQTRDGAGTHGSLAIHRNYLAFRANQLNRGRLGRTVVVLVVTVFVAVVYCADL